MHSIDTQGSSPNREPPRRIPHHLKDEIKRQLDELVEAQIIEPSSSEWATALVPVKKKNGKIIYNNEIKNIKYIKKKYVVTTNLHISFTSDIIFTTISKDNLNAFSFWNNDQKIYLNSVTAVNSTIIKNILDKLILNKLDHNKTSNITDVRKTLLNELHIVYPYCTNKSKYVFIWNNGANNILIREKIKNMYNDKFIICSESYSKNNMFINYSLEYVDSALIKLHKFI